MERVLQNLNPQNVFYFFEVLSSIPRGSGHEKQVSDYLVSFAKERGLKVEQDAVYNVVIHKPASAGCEKAPVVMLQNHMDMVCEKFPDCNLDMEKEGLRLAIDEEKGTVYARGTSLGADNGIGLAVALAILDDNTLIHPELEVVCTVAEEAGLVGAGKMDMSALCGKYMINSDSYRLSMVQAGCAGSSHLAVTQPVTWTDTAAFERGARLYVSGLIGGHSGLDATLQRTNAHKLMARLLDSLLRGGVAFSVSGYTSYNKDNAIPREATCYIAIRETSVAKAETVVAEFLEAEKEELKATDPNVNCALYWTEKPERCLCAEDTEKMICYMMLAPDGMFQKFYAFDDPLLAESSCNFGRVLFEENSIVYRHMIRANYHSRKVETTRKFDWLCRAVGMSYEIVSDAPGWDLDLNSELLAILQKCYREMTGGEEIEVSVAHGTCECGFFKENTGCDTVSIGPDIHHLHSPLEEVEIDSVGRLYDLNIRMLAELAKKK